MIYLWITIAILAGAELFLFQKLRRLEAKLSEESEEEKLEKFSEAVADILSYDLEKAKEATKNE